MKTDWYEFLQYPSLLRDTGRLHFGKNTNLCNGKVECLNQFVGILYQLMFFIEMDKWYL